MFLLFIAFIKLISLLYLICFDMSDFKTPGSIGNIKNTLILFNSEKYKESYVSLRVHVWIAMHAYELYTCILTHIYMCVCVPTKGFVFKLFFFNMCFWYFKLSSGSEMVCGNIRTNYFTSWRWHKMSETCVEEK